MKAKPDAGFSELGHGADAAIEVWAPELEGLFRQSALGMLALMGTVPAASNPSTHLLELTAPDNESLLVAFLSQLLFLLEQEHRIYSVKGMTLQPGKLTATLTGIRLGSIQREIKAVTFNDLAIRRVDDLYRVIIVFDL